MADRDKEREEQSRADAADRLYRQKAREDGNRDSMDNYYRKQREERDRR